MPSKRPRPKAAARAELPLVALAGLGLLRLRPVPWLRRLAPRLALRRLQLRLDGTALVGVLEALLQDRDRLVGPARQAQRVAEVEGRVGARVGRLDRAAVDGALQDRDRLVVVALLDERVALGLKGRLVVRRRRRGRGGRGRLAARP